MVKLETKKAQPPKFSPAFEMLSSLFLPTQMNGIKEETDEDSDIPLPSIRKNRSRMRSNLR